MRQPLFEIGVLEAFLLRTLALFVRQHVGAALGRTGHGIQQFVSPCEGVGDGRVAGPVGTVTQPAKGEEGPSAPTPVIWQGAYLLGPVAASQDRFLLVARWGRIRPPFAATVFTRRREVPHPWRVVYPVFIER